jgi:hypothetical protein
MKGVPGLSPGQRPVPYHHANAPPTWVAARFPEQKRDRIRNCSTDRAHGRRLRSRPLKGYPGLGGTVNA